MRDVLGCGNTLQLRDSNSAVRAFICQGDEAAALPLLDGHFRDDGDSNSRRHHRHDGCELPALKCYVGMQAGAPACRQPVLAETVAFFQQQKWITLDFRESEPRSFCQAVMLRHHHEQLLTKQFPEAAKTHCAIFVD